MNILLKCLHFFSQKTIEVNPPLTESGGTGLGLFVAKKMLDDMGGKVTAESEGEGLGSTFTIEFPLLNSK